MREELIQDIRNYINFLETQGYIVSISFMRDSFASFAQELLQYDFHPHPVCNFVKQHPSTAGRCVHNKAILRAMRLREPFYGCCYAGVEEFLVPQYDGDTFLCYIHVSGYRGKLPQSAKKAERIADPQFMELYGGLSENPPSMQTVLAFVRPLQHMLMQLRKLYLDIRESATEPTRRLYVKALQYIQENYGNPIDCDDIAEFLQYSASYVRYIFRKEGDTSVQAKINEVRLQNAKRLLRSTGMSITEIAYAVGFSDSNYFSSFFKKQTGKTPRQYRHQN